MPFHNTRFTSNIDTDSNSFVLIDRGDILQPKPAPVVWAVFPIYDNTPNGKTEASARCRFVTGLLNGLRDRSDQVEIS